MLGPDHDWTCVAALGNQWTLLKDELPVLCGGLILWWYGRAESWSVISERVGRAELLVIHRIVRRHLDYAQREERFRRIEAFAVSSFPQGERWLKMLGYEPEGVMRKYMPSGEDAVRYARIR